MFGVPVTGNTDLRRLLNDYMFKGFPMRKNYPLSGFTELWWENSQSCVVRERLELMQAMRSQISKRFTVLQKNLEDESTISEDSSKDELNAKNLQK